MTRRSYDVIVVGLGGMGSAAAYHLSRRGQRVLGLEQFGRVHDRGSSHGGSRLIRHACYEDPAYVPLVQRALGLWRELEESSGEKVLLNTGVLVLGSPDCPRVIGAQAVAAQFGLDHEMLSAPAIRRRFPTLLPSDDTVAYYEAGAGVLHPERAVAAHLDLAEAAGAEFHFVEPVVEWSGNGGGGLTVRTEAGSYSAGRLVVCPGAWAPDLLGDLRIRLTPQRLVVTRFQPEGGVTPFLPDRSPVWLWDTGTNSELGFAGLLYGFPALDGPDGGVKLSQVDERPCTAGTVDRVVTAAEIEDVAAALRSHLTVALGPVVEARVCMWVNTPDHHFVLGPLPEEPEVIVAAGCSGHGFKYVPVIGEILAELVVDGKTSHSVALFDPGR
ncbi:MAG TPA: N-methyl-L-tryptophan oxidase [Acidimicrobiia bacterium]|nr:N-methyl-L-tryptophan oxidase [Acidimicrobiia bacterium]